MATDRGYNDEQKFIGNSADTRPNLSLNKSPQSPRQPIPSVSYASSQAATTCPYPLETPSSSHKSPALVPSQKLTEQTPMSHRDKPTQNTSQKDPSHGNKASPVKRAQNLPKVEQSVTLCLPGTSHRGSAYSDTQKSSWTKQNILKVPSHSGIPTSFQNKTFVSDPKLAPTFQAPYLPAFSGSETSDEEPLNLTVGSKADEKVKTASTLAGVRKEETCGKIPESANSGKVTSKVRNYKEAHPIGSRKVTENVITYHEPMFQSVANSLFENQKNLQMGKRKAEEDKSKGEPGAKDKKIKLDTSASPSKIVDGKVVVKKKCSIENIIERIRTEKTVSRGGNGQPSKQSDEDEEKSKTNKDLQNESQSNEKTKEQSTSNRTSLTEKDKVDSAIKTPNSKTQGQVNGQKKTENVKVKEENEKNLNGKEMKSVKVNEAKTCELSDKRDTEAKEIKMESAISKQNKSEKDSTKPKKTNIIPSKQNKESKPSEKLPKKLSPKKTDKEQNDTKKIKVEKCSPKQKKLRECSSNKTDDLISTGSENIEDDKLKTTEKKPVAKAKKKLGENCKQDSKVKKFTNVKDLKGRRTSKEEKNESDSDTEVDEIEVLEIKKTIGEKVKVKRNSQSSSEKSIEGPKKPGRKKKSEIELSDKKIDVKKKPESAVKSGMKKPEKTRVVKQRKQKLPIACRRVKREASLNATMFLNILNEKSPRGPKLASQRSKSDSDIKHVQVESVQSSHSMIDLGGGENPRLNDTKKEIKSPKQRKSFLNKSLDDDFAKAGSDFIQDSASRSRTESKSEKKSLSPKRKVSFSDSTFEDVFESVIQRSIDATENLQPPKKKRGRKSFKEIELEKRSRKNGIEKLESEKDVDELKVKKKKKFRLEKIKQAIKLSASKSPEEAQEKKRKANLARLERAKEFMKTERKVSEKNCIEDKDSDDSVSDTNSEREDSKPIDQEELKNDDDIKKVKAKKGALFRSARTHVSVESKTVVENTMPSPRWCECCQSSYYPYQQTQGTQVWRIKHLVDKDSSKSPEPIQSSSNHFIAAHARCEVRPYASPSHVSVIDSSPYVGQIVPHGHIQCSACSCGHSGVFHPGQCQNCTLGGVGNMLPCQRYGSTYSVTYPHTHGSYTHCGCGACYTAGSYHHSVGQTLIHQPQMSMSESSILLHHPVPLQVAHETTHPVTMPAISHSHTDSSLTHPVQPMSLQLSHSESDLNSLTHMCQLSQGEVTNVSAMASSSPCDQEIDVGSRDDIVKSVPNISQSSSIVKHSTKEMTSSIKPKTFQLKEPLVKRKKSECSDNKRKNSSSDEIVKKRKKNLDEEQAKTFKLKECKVKLKEKKNSSLLLIKQKQKQLEQKSLKLSQKKDSKSSSVLSENMGSKKVRIKSSDSKTPKKVKKGASIESNEGLKDQGNRAWHGWSWKDEGMVKKVVNIFDGQTVERKCFSAIRHDDGDYIQVKDCVLVRSGLKEKDIPYVAKVSNLWEDPHNGEMMMSVLWFYRPEHAEGGPILGSLENEVFAAKHKDEILVACIEDKGYVLTYNEYCRFMAEVERTKSDLPPRKKVVPEPEESYPSYRIPPVDINPENVFLCRQVYDIKLKRVLKNPS